MYPNFFGYLQEHEIYKILDRVQVQFLRIHVRIGSQLIVIEPYGYKISRSERTGIR